MTGHSNDMFPFSPSDMYALSSALQFKAIVPDTKVFVLSMGPRQASLALKDCFSYDVDEVFLLTDPCYAGSDTLATTYILSKGIEQIQKTYPVDMILCGDKTIDSSTGQVGPGLAFRLDFFYFDFIDKFLYNNNKLTLINQTYSCTFEGQGVVATVGKPNILPFPSMTSIIKAKHRNITVWTNNDLDLPKKRIGLSGSPTRILKIKESPVIPNSGKVIQGSLDEISNELRNQIITKKTECW